LTKPLPLVDDNYDLVCLKKDEALGLIALYVEPDLIYHMKDNKSAKEIWDTFKKLFGIVNTTLVNKVESGFLILRWVTLTMLKSILQVLRTSMLASLH
jgi:hypothetical protein